MLFLYRIGIWLYRTGLSVAAPFHKKARRFVHGRRNIISALNENLAQKESIRIWFHVASLGEFEQARPVMEALKGRLPNWKILLTFFSPSGYEIRKDYQDADWIFYLPLDTEKNAREFVSITKPDLAIFVKYDFWYFYLKSLLEHEIPVLVISALFRKDQIYFQWYGKFMLKIFRRLSHYYVQNDQSAHVLNTHGIHQYTVSGDTRVDRVKKLAEQSVPDNQVRSFAEDSVVMICGSVWPSDREVLKPFILERMKTIKFIIAPHEIKEAELRAWLKLPNSTLYSQLDGEGLKTARILVIDNIGMLSGLYRLGDYAYVGGAFRGALHNILEPAAFGLPIFFGKHQNNVKFKEAGALVSDGGAFSIGSSRELADSFDELKGEAYNRACHCSSAYINNHSGASKLILKGIEKMIHK